MVFLYFAYGSNLLAQRMHINCPSARRKCIGELKKFKLGFCDFSNAWKGAAATIVESHQDSVWGVVWEISKEHEEMLNKQEKGYTPMMAIVESPGYGEVGCKTYIKLNYNADGSEVPSLVYKTVMLQGAIESKLPLNYIQKLEKIVDNGYRGKVDFPINIKL